MYTLPEGLWVRLNDGMGGAFWCLSAGKQIPWIGKRTLLIAFRRVRVKVFWRRSHLYIILNMNMDSASYIAVRYICLRSTAEFPDAQTFSQLPPPPRLLWLLYLKRDFLPRYVAGNWSLGWFGFDIDHFGCLFVEIVCLFGFNSEVESYIKYRKWRFVGLMCLLDFKINYSPFRTWTTTTALA